MSVRSYLLVSTIVFDLLAVVQLTRFLLGWPVTVAGFSVPVWASAIAAIAIGSLAVWGMRLLVKTRAADPGT